MSLGHERRLKGRPKRTRCGQADISRTRHGRAELSSTRNRQRCDEGYGPIAAAGQRRFLAAYDRCILGFQLVCDSRAASAKDLNSVSSRPMTKR